MLRTYLFAHPSPRRASASANSLGAAAPGFKSILITGGSIRRAERPRDFARSKAVMLPTID